MLSVAEAELLAASWQLALRAERKSPQTLKTYGDGIRFYLAWCAEQHLAAAVAALAAGAGAEPCVATAFL
ncbi:MAG: hypothetical protein M3Y66_01525 [Actinomycetota bacterium]|nr:hypothetical protein [Actinomycetota bacterium]